MTDIDDQDESLSRVGFVSSNGIRISVAEGSRDLVVEGQVLYAAIADALQEFFRKQERQSPLADDLREALIRELHPDYPTPIPALNQLYGDHADRFLARFEVRPRGTVTDASRR